MNKNAFLKTVFFVFLSVSLLAYAQTTKKIELTQLSLEQKLDRAVMNPVSYMMFGISYAKSLGKTPEEFAEYCAKTVLPFYEGYCLVLEDVFLVPFEIIRNSQDSSIVIARSAATRQSHKLREKLIAHGS